jgi:hypothetical protein
VTKAEKGTISAGSTVEFTKDGKVKAFIKKGEDSENIEGTHKVVKNTVTLTRKAGDDLRAPSPCDVKTPFRGRDQCE